MQIKYLNRAKRIVTINCGSLRVIGELVPMLQNLGYQILSVKGI